MLTLFSPELCLFTWFVKKILDNCDGKQARKTGNCSTLGMLFDHGCDTLTSMTLTVTFVHIMGVTGDMYYILILAVSMAFFVPTLDQFNYQIHKWQFGLASNKCSK